MEISSFSCSICSDVSHKICVYCTKDACNNHLCFRCLRCSECCHCDKPTTAQEEEIAAVAAVEVEETEPEPEPTPSLT